MRVESFQIARTNTNDESGKLVSPYEMNKTDLIQAGEDFTIRMTTISKSVLDRYGADMKRGRFGNEYFIVMSHFGIGSNSEQAPSPTINFIAPQNSIDSDVLSFWGENIRWIEDYRVNGQDENSGRIFLRVSAFCQTLGDNSKLNNIEKALNEASKMAGRLSPTLVPYSSLAVSVIDGIFNILKKLTEHIHEVVESEITLYPCSVNRRLDSGDAYLQRGSYVFFYGETLLEGLSLTKSGRVVADSTFKGEIPPYVVVNIVDGLCDAPSSSVLNKAVALDILEKYDEKFGALSKETSPASGASFNDGLMKIGESYRMLTKIRRLNELLAKETLSEAEQSRLATLKEDLKSILPST